MAKKINLDDLFSDGVDDEREVIPTGIRFVDPNLGGGLPSGVMVEAYGPEGSGKTSLGYCHIAEQQKRGNISVLFDAERSWNPSMGARYGIDTQHKNKKGNLTFRMTDKPEIKVMETLFSRIKIMLENMPEVRFIMVDSAAALAAQSVVDKTEGDQRNTDGMENARVFNGLLRDLDRWIAENGNNTTVYFVNHEKEVIGMGGGYGPPKTDTPLGRALKFYASFRLQFRKVKTEKVKHYDPLTKQTINSEDRLYIRVQATKNRYYPPFRPSTFIFDLGEGTGIDSVSTALAHAIAQGVIPVALNEPEMGKNGKLKKPTPKKGYWAVPKEYSVSGEPEEIHGLPKLTRYFEDNPKQFAKLEDYVVAHLADSGTRAVDEEDEDDDSNMIDLAD